MKKIAILGSTGSIGTQTLDIVREQGDIQVVAMAAGSNISLLEAQMREFKPSLVSVWDEKKASELRTNTKDLGIKIVSGMEGLLEVSVIPESEILVTAIVGMLGIRPTIAAIKAGKCFGKQGNTCHCRTYYYSACKGIQGADSSGGQRTQCDFPVAAGCRG